MSDKKKVVKTTLISFEEYESDEFKPPALYYIITATGVLYIHCRKRQDATDYVKEEWNNKYSLRTETKAQVR